MVENNALQVSQVPLKSILIFHFYIAQADFFFFFGSCEKLMLDSNYT